MNDLVNNEEQPEYSAKAPLGKQAAVFLQLLDVHRALMELCVEKFDETSRYRRIKLLGFFCKTIIAIRKLDQKRLKLPVSPRKATHALKSYFAECQQIRNACIKEKELLIRALKTKAKTNVKKKKVKHVCRGRCRD